ncbi:GNAT family N-acetyltransferase [Ectobacillus panaciterrae]|uniref:GNAT family N-acetyltransferase n=1 Tax=Ectobacillus panaciterrae TaxID=363872 RepID=UPI000404B2EC|nr:GNAT family N-acetyltransferase [Ectobacillus panaciterrae]
MNQLLLDFPTMFQTERLQVRKPFPGDGTELFEALQISLTDLQPWLSYGQNILTEEDAEADVRESHAKFLLRDELRFHLYKKSDSSFLGMLTLHPANWHIPSFTLSFWISSTHRNQGYMTEALEGLIKFTFEKLGAKRLEVRCDSSNEAAKRLAEHVGFILEGTLHNDRLATGSDEVRHTCVYARTKK